MGHIRLIGTRKAGKQANKQKELSAGRGNVKLKGTRLSKSYNSRSGGHPLANKPTPTDKASGVPSARFSNTYTKIGVPRICWLWWPFTYNLHCKYEPTVQCLREGRPGQQKQIWCVSCLCPCAHFIENSFAHNVYEKASSFSNNTYAKAKERRKP